jgi:hypothetical protein
MGRDAPQISPHQHPTGLNHKLTPRPETPVPRHPAWVVGPSAVRRQGPDGHSPGTARATPVLDAGPSRTAEPPPRPSALGSARAGHERGDEREDRDRSASIDVAPRAAHPGPLTWQFPPSMSDCRSTPGPLLLSIRLVAFGDGRPIADSGFKPPEASSGVVPGMIERPIVVKIVVIGARTPVGKSDRGSFSL